MPLFFWQVAILLIILVVLKSFHNIQGPITPARKTHRSQKHTFFWLPKIAGFSIHQQFKQNLFNNFTKYQALWLSNCFTTEATTTMTIILNKKTLIAQPQNNTQGTGTLARKTGAGTVKKCILHSEMKWIEVSNLLMPPCQLKTLHLRGKNWRIKRHRGSHILVRTYSPWICHSSFLAPKQNTNTKCSVGTYTYFPAFKSTSDSLQWSPSSDHVNPGHFNLLHKEAADKKAGGKNNIRIVASLCLPF